MANPSAGGDAFAAPPASVGVHCDAYVQRAERQYYAESGVLSGTTGKALRDEALKMTLQGMPGYEVE